MTRLRCLIFSSNQDVVRPIRQVLADLGIEEEHRDKGVDAVRSVTSEAFQFVITDWEDQPEAEFLLKTTRDLKASLRPLTLAVVGDDAKRPQALQAGANSILLKPVDPEHLRDTMSTACELLRSKLPTAVVAVPQMAAAMSAAAGAGISSPPVSVRQAPEKIRAGEFLQSSGTAPGAQFDTEPEMPSTEESNIEVKAVTDLEPMAAAPEAPSSQAKATEAVTGWAMLQSRLTAPRAASAAPPPKRDFLANSDAPFSQGTSTASPLTKEQKQWRGGPAETHGFASSFDAAQGEEYLPPARRAGRGKFFLFAALAAACITAAAMPGTRPSLLALYRNGLLAGSRFLNPPPAALPQPVAIHDSFGQSGDEYNLPAPGNIPDATTDPAQIRVLAVVDPTAKAKKGEAAASPDLGMSSEATAPTQSEASNPGSQTEEHEVRDAPPAVTVNAPADASQKSPELGVPEATAPVASPASPQSDPRIVAPRSAPLHPASASVGAGIPRSLQSHVATSTPQASGSKPVEAAMASIEPVKLAEPVERELLLQPVNAVYPARANGQKGTVVLQLLVGRDGAVQEAKFLQGSLLFARSAIEAVKQYRFKPYVMNGHPVSVQSVITLNFIPPA